MPCTHGIPVGMMWVQTKPTPRDTPANNPLYNQKLYQDMQVIKDPASAWSSFVACDRVVREDKWFTGQPPGEQYPQDNINQVIDRWKAFIEAARAAGVKCSIGYVWKLFSARPVNEINQFVDTICNITDVGNVVENWHVVDEPVKLEDRGEINKTAVRDLVKTINDRQHLPANGNRDWPFHIVLSADQEGTKSFWPVHGNDRYYDPDIRFKDYIDAVTACWPTGAGAKVIISLFYYPWSANQWRYGSLPPWRKWRFILEKFRQWYPSSTMHPIHFILEGGANNQNYLYHLAGHVDMHQQVRVARNYGVQGIWIWGWGNRDSAPSQNLNYTMPHWVDSSFSNFYVSGHDERWGEAVANEVTAAYEGISAAIPTTSKIVGTTEIPNGFWIKYWLASRGKVEFRIHDQSGTWVKRIDLGYKNNASKPSFSESWNNFYNSVAGKYEYTPGVNRGSGNNDLFGTAAYWNKTNNDFQIIQNPNNPYTIHMYVNGGEVGCPVQVNL